MKFLIALIALAFTTALFGQDAAPASNSFFDLPEGFMSKFIVWVVALQALALGIGKGLTEVSKLTENKWDNMAANAFTKVAWFLGSIISKFGWGMPKQVVLKKAEALKEAEKK